MDIVRANNTDLREILELQYLAYQSEAALFGNTDIPPLKETLSELEAEFEKGIILKMVDVTGKIMGSVRSRSDEKTVYIGKLMVHPDQQKKGYGKKMLSEIERYYPNKRFELFTSTRSIDNIRLYEKMGYKKFKEEKVTDELVFVYLEKE
ncbi:MAG: GNAT family N-acetyltransferase [Lachnospiraceae bacterium]|nr:GNAT family N-acetyltransferase [Lachnospiraceae bacterium]